MKNKRATIATMLFTGGALAACSPSAEWVKKQKDSVETVLIAENFGHKLRSINGVSSLEITDYDGVRSKRSWTYDPADKGKFHALDVCLDDGERRNFHRDTLDSAVGKVKVELPRDIAATCMQQIGLPAVQEIRQENIEGFLIVLSVLADQRVFSGGGAPLLQSDGRRLGGKFQVKRPGIRYESVQPDADSCLEAAAGRGVVRSYGGYPFGESSSEMIHSAISIDAFLGRFRDCLRGLGYSVDDYGAAAAR